MLVTIVIVIVMMIAGQVNMSANRMPVRLDDASPGVRMGQSLPQHEERNQ